MRKHLALVLLSVGLLAGCNTIQGIGKDVSKAGQTIEEAARKK